MGRYNGPDLLVRRVVSAVHQVKQEFQGFSNRFVFCLAVIKLLSVGLQNGGKTEGRKK